MAIYWSCWTHGGLQEIPLNLLNLLEHFIKSIEVDYRLAMKAYEKITGYNYPLERNKVISSSINYRNPFTDLLNYSQIELLKRHQSLDQQTKESEAIIFSSINHLAAAMQTSGWIILKCQACYSNAKKW